MAAAVAASAEERLVAWEATFVVQAAAEGSEGRHRSPHSLGIVEAVVSAVGVAAAATGLNAELEVVKAEAKEVPPL